MFKFFERILNKTAVGVVGYGVGAGVGEICRKNIFEIKPYLAGVVVGTNSIMRLYDDTSFSCVPITTVALYLVEKSKNILVSLGSDPNLALATATTLISGTCLALAKLCSSLDQQQNLPAARPS